VTDTEASDYAIRELSARSGVTQRTIRFYVQQGLLPAPEGSGRGSRYTEGHLARLRLIRLLQDRHLPLAEIRRQLDSLDDRDAHTLLRQTAGSTHSSAVDYIRAVLQSSRSSSPIAAPPPAPEPPSSQRCQWERISLTPDVEIHIRRPLSRPQSRRIERLVEYARQLLQTEEP
jgi:DNA-binding transcriptional MerR regulator